MNISIRPLQGEAMFEPLYLLDHYSFQPSPPLGNQEEWLADMRGREGLTCFGAFEGETPAAIAVSSAMTQNMRGALYPSAGVWGVSTHPSARRKGYGRQSVLALLAAERESGKVFSSLYPFRESFYERLGYVTYPLTKIAKFSPAALAPLLKMDLGGEATMQLISEAYDDYRAFLADMLRRQHGMVVFDHGSRPAKDRSRQWSVAARFDGQAEGWMLYALQGGEVTAFNFYASRFYYKTSRARALLLQWIARHIDQAERAEVRLASSETPETWLPDMQVKVETAIRAPMSRVLDVAGIGGMQVGAGGFSAQITDPFCPWNQEVWRFESTGGRLVVSKAAQADCELTIQGLTALVAGAHDPEDFALRGWGSPGAAVQAIQRSMFPRLSPHLHEVF